MTKLGHDGNRAEQAGLPNNFSIFLPSLLGNTEFLIVVYNGAGLSTAAPENAPQETFIITVEPSNICITGTATTPDGEGIGGVEVEVIASTEFESTSTVSAEDRSFKLYLPFADVWDLSAIPPPGYYFDNSNEDRGYQCRLSATIIDNNGIQGAWIGLLLDPEDTTGFTQLVRR